MFSKNTCVCVLLKTWELWYYNPEKNFYLVSLLIFRLKGTGLWQPKTFPGTREKISAKSSKTVIVWFFFWV